MTQLPEPEHNDHVDVRFKRHNCYTEAQLKEYGAAEYARAIADAVKICDDLNNYPGHSSKRPTPGQCGWAVRQLGAAS